VVNVALMFHIMIGRQITTSKCVLCLIIAVAIIVASTLILRVVSKCEFLLSQEHWFADGQFDMLNDLSESHSATAVSGFGSRKFQVRKVARDGADVTSGGRHFRKCASTFKSANCQL